MKMLAGLMCLALALLQVYPAQSQSSSLVNMPVPTSVAATTNLISAIPSSEVAELFPSSSVAEPFSSSSVVEPFSTQSASSPLISSSAALAMSLSVTSSAPTTTSTSSTTLVPSPTLDMATLPTTEEDRTTPTTEEGMTTPRTEGRPTTSGTTGTSTDDSSPPPTMPASQRRLVFIYIVVGILVGALILVLVVVVCVCVACEHHKHKKTQRRRGRAGHKLLVEKPDKALQQRMVKERSPKQVGVKIEESGSMTDFSLLVKVLDKYGSTDHNDRIQRCDSVDFELSCKTTVSNLSPDCDTLDQLIESLKVEAGEVAIPCNIKPDNVSLPAPSSNDVDEFGYHRINIGQMIKKGEDLRRSQSAGNIFDDPQYMTHDTVARQQSAPEQQQQQHRDMVPSSSMTMSPSMAPNDSEAIPRSQSTSGLEGAYSLSGIDAFEQKKNKQYMSLQNLMDIFKSKMSPHPVVQTTPTSPPPQMQSPSNDLYGPRLVLPQN